MPYVFPIYKYKVKPKTTYKWSFFFEPLKVGCYNPSETHLCVRPFIGTTHVIPFLTP